MVTAENIKGEVRERLPVVEELGVEDLEELSRLGQYFYEEAGKSGGRGLPGRFVRAVFVNTWRGLMGLGMGRILGLRRGEEIVGALGFFLTADPNDGETKGSEAFWWVKPEARGHGLRLLREFERAAQEAGATRLEMVHLAGLNERLERIYEGMGYERVEVHYVKVLGGE